MDRVAKTKTVPAAPGIIETIASALSLVLAHPLLVAVPVIADLYIWVGVRISPKALTDASVRLVLKTDTGDASRIVDLLDRLGKNADLTSLMASLVPSLLAGMPRGDLPAVWSRASYGLDSWWLVAVVAVLLLIAAAGLGMVYRVPMAVIIHGDAPSVRRIVRAAGLAWLRFFGLVAILIGLVLLIGGPVLVLGGVLQILGVNIIPILSVAVVVPAIAAAIYLYFAIDAIVLSEVGPLRAMYLSFNVVRRNFWPTVGFAGAVLLISTGLPELWLHLVGTPPGLLLAVLANAFISTGLATASMMFYESRLRRWRPDAAWSRPAPAAPPATSSNY